MITDNGQNFGNMTIRQSRSWGVLALRLFNLGITKRLFIGSHAGGDSARNFIERFWTRVYKSLVGLSFPDEPESMVKVCTILDNSGHNCSMATSHPTDWHYPNVSEKTLFKNLHKYPYLLEFSYEKNPDTQFQYLFGTDKSGWPACGEKRASVTGYCDYCSAQKPPRPYFYWSEKEKNDHYKIAHQETIQKEKEDERKKVAQEKQKKKEEEQSQKKAAQEKKKAEAAEKKRLLEAEKKKKQEELKQKKKDELIAKKRRAEELKQKKKEDFRVVGPNWAKLG